LNPFFYRNPRALLEQSESKQTSGARYSGVPQNVFVLAPKDISSLHKPKSAICKEKHASFSMNWNEYNYWKGNFGQTFST